jgi:hypothetical protein
MSFWAEQSWGWWSQLSLERCDEPMIFLSERWAMWASAGIWAAEALLMSCSEPVDTLVWMIPWWRCWPYLLDEPVSRFYLFAAYLLYYLSIYLLTLICFPGLLCSVLAHRWFRWRAEHYDRKPFADDDKDKPGLQFYFPMSHLFACMSLHSCLPDFHFLI